MNILITGTSQGLGRTLALNLINQGHRVWGISRREKLLKNLSDNNPKFSYTKIDLKSGSSWEKIKKEIANAKFNPDVVIFNAATFKDSQTGGNDLNIIKKVINLNFYSIIKGINVLTSSYNKAIHFIAISSSSSFKGSAKEGIAYASSKAALSIAFESLYQKHKNSNFKFTTVFFGPINTGMNPRKNIFSVSEKNAVKIILKAIDEKKPVYYYPSSLFYFLFFIKLLPANLYFNLIEFMEKLHHKL